jgi:glycosyltransferase involved in cell wall biosynthesis
MLSLGDSSFQEICLFCIKKELKIVVNTRLLLKDKLEGIGWFTFETLKRITSNNPNDEFFFVFDRPWNKEFKFDPNVTPIYTYPQARHPILFYIWFEWALPRIIKKVSPDIFLSPDGYLSLSAKVKSLAVIHDLNFHHRPMDLPYLNRKYYNYYFPLFAKKASRIATVSEYSKRDISESYGIDEALIDVVYNGANEMFAPISEEEKKVIRNKHSLGCNYFTYIGSLHPRKNIKNLVLAFNRYKHNAESDDKLIIVGERMFLTSDIDKEIINSKYKNDILFTGRLTSEELHKVLAASKALTFVPFFEGFGVPALEAMKCNIPVIASNVTSLPEVCGNAAYYVNPSSVEDIADALRMIDSNKELQLDLIQKGRIQCQRYNWDKTANLLWESIKKCQLQ